MSNLVDKRHWRMSSVVPRRGERFGRRNSARPSLFQAHDASELDGVAIAGMAIDVALRQRARFAVAAGLGQRAHAEQ